MYAGKKGEYMALEYFVSHRNNIAVLSLAGELNVQGLEKFEECRRQLETIPIRYLVINFAEISEVTDEALRPLTTLQSMVRKLDVEIRLCGLRQEIVEFLMTRGAIRQNEIRIDLLEALKSLDLKVANAA